MTDHDHRVRLAEAYASVDGAYQAARWSVYDKHPAGAPDLDRLSGSQRAVLAELQATEAHLDRQRHA